MMHRNILYDSAETVSEKNLVFQLWPKMLLISQTAEFLNHQYLWKESLNMLDFLHEV